MGLESLIEGKYYHVYNRGNNRRNLFEKPDDYEHFLWLYDKYVSPVADTLAWVLMPNHFHLVVKIKKDVVYKYSLNDVKTGLQAEKFDRKKLMESFNMKKWETVDLSEYENFSDEIKPKRPVPHRHFAHLFNAYARWFNVRTNNSGSLFELTFKRKLIDNEKYLKNAVLYVHNNPIHHGFCGHLLEYPWSSFISFTSEKSKDLMRESVLQLFDGKEKFVNQHYNQIDIDNIEKWLELDETDYYYKPELENENEYID